MSPGPLPSGLTSCRSPAAYGCQVHRLVPRCRELGHVRKPGLNHPMSSSVSGLALQGIEPLCPNSAIGSAEDVHQAPMITLEVSGEQVLLRSVDVLANQAGYLRYVRSVGVPIWRLATGMRTTNEVARVIPDDLVSQGDPVSRKVRRPTDRIHSIPDTMQLKPQSRVDQPVDLSLQLAPTLHGFNPTQPSSLRVSHGYRSSTATACRTPGLGSAPGESSHVPPPAEPPRIPQPPARPRGMPDTHPERGTSPRLRPWLPAPPRSCPRKSAWSTSSSRAISDRAVGSCLGQALPCRRLLAQQSPPGPIDR